MNWLWLALGAAFLAIEGWALTSKNDGLDPLTHHVRRALKHPAGFTAITGFFVWLIAHFYLGI